MARFTRAKDRSLDDQPLSGLRILLAEDEALIALDVDETCRGHGAADVRVLRNGKSAVAADLDNCDLAIIDVMVGGHETVELALALQRRRIPFIFATAHPLGAEISAGFPEVPVVRKPYFGDSLVDGLRNAIAQHRR